jgi:hypothetical protein
MMADELVHSSLPPPAQSEGSARALALPALRTVQAVRPHPALQSVRSASGWACPLIGFLKGAKPLRSQDSSRSALLVFRGPTNARPVVPLPQERPEAATDNAIDGTQCRASRMFDVPQPPPEERMEFGNALRQAPACPSCTQCQSTVPKFACGRDYPRPADGSRFCILADGVVG